MKSVVGPPSIVENLCSGVGLAFCGVFLKKLNYLKITSACVSAVVFEVSVWGHYGMVFLKMLSLGLVWSSFGLGSRVRSVFR